MSGGEGEGEGEPQDECTGVAGLTYVFLAITPLLPGEGEGEGEGDPECVPGLPGGDSANAILTLAGQYADYVTVTGSTATLPPGAERERKWLVRHNTRVTLTAQADPEAAGHFAGFQIGTGACILKGTAVTVDETEYYRLDLLITYDVTVNVLYQREQLVTLDIVGKGTLYYNPEGDDVHAERTLSKDTAPVTTTVNLPWTTCDVTATPASGWTFARWEGDSAVDGRAAPSLTGVNLVGANPRVTAHFIQCASGSEAPYVVIDEDFTSAMLG